MKKKSMKEQILDRSRALNPEQKKREQLFVITWDNPANGDYNKMFEVIKTLGKMKKLLVKTAATLAPGSGITHKIIREKIGAALNQKIGSAVIVNIGNARIAHINFAKVKSWKTGYPKDI